MTHTLYFEAETAHTFHTRREKKSEPPLRSRRAENFIRAVDAIAASVTTSRKKAEAFVRRLPADRHILTAHEEESLLSLHFIYVEMPTSHRTSHDILIIFCVGS